MPTGVKPTSNKKSKHTKMSTKDTKPHSGKIYTVVDPTLHKKIKSLAIKQKISISKLLKTAIEAYLKK